jgi:hypothetical protein
MVTTGGLCGKKNSRKFHCQHCLTVVLDSIEFTINPIADS